MRTPGLPTSLYAAARLYAGEQLQRLLVATIDLGLVVDHAHWNVNGRGAHALHALCDDLSDGLACHRGVLARRAAELGVAPDGRPGTVAAESVPTLRNGPLPATDAAAAIADRLDRVADLAQEHLNGLGASDPTTHDVVIELEQFIKRHRAILQRAGDGG